MKPLGDARRHFWLAQRMARNGGLDLAGAKARGDLDQESWARMVQRCRGCDWTTGCERFLAFGQGVETLPVNCRNRRQFRALKVVEEMEETT